MRNEWARGSRAMFITAVNCFTLGHYCRGAVISRVNVLHRRYVPPTVIRKREACLIPRGRIRKRCHKTLGESWNFHGEKRR